MMRNHGGKKKMPKGYKKKGKSKKKTTTAKMNKGPRNRNAMYGNSY